MAELIVIDNARPAPASLPDAAERASALDIRRSWIVEAPAGSGKTGLLIQRYLMLLADESVTTPEQVLAITFTRKATAEMRERVLGQLQAAANGDAPANAFDRETRPMAEAALARDRALGWSLIDQPHRLRVRTIDSVCSEIANSLPVLSGTGGRREVVDDAGDLYTIAAHRTFLQLGGTDAQLHQALREVLLHRDGDLINCERLLASMLKLREQWGSLVPLGRRQLDDAYLDANVLPKLERALNNAICSALTKVTKAFPEHLLRQLTMAAASMAHLEGYKGRVSPIALCANKTVPPSQRSEDLDHWRALAHLLLTSSNPGWRKRFNKNDVYFETTKTERTRLETLITEFHQHPGLLTALCSLDTLPPAQYPQDQWAIAKQLFRVLQQAMVELQLVFAERGQCDYTEIALAAKTALRADDGPHDLEAALGLRLQHILVDEMQDTSSSQYELIQMLTAHFDGHSQTAFLVGDPKQSIYLFRQARVERFLRAMAEERIGDLPLGVLRLTANFRSQAGLVGHFNDDFELIFHGATGNAEEVQYVRAVAMRDAESDAANRVWHPDVLPYVPRGVTSNGVALRQQESAREVREIVDFWRAKPLPEDRTSPWKIAVLVRARKHLEEIVAAFKDATIPYRAVDIDPLKDRPEVQDLFALTRALLHPADRTAWLAVLSAPWSGFGLAELHVLTGEDDPAFADWTMRRLIAERGDLLAPEAITRLERIWPVLEAATALRQRAPFAQTVERTWRSLGGDAYLDSAELANARCYLNLLGELDVQADGVSVAAVEAGLNRLFAAPSLDPTAVEFLTIHKAKGLEWDVVLVPGLERAGGRGRSEFLHWVELDSGGAPEGEDTAHFLLATISAKGEDANQLKRWIDGVHRSREAGEDRRLFYVACTRAREELHLFAAPKLSAKGELSLPAGTLLKAAWPAAEATFAGPLASAGLPSKVVAFPPSRDSLELAASAPDAQPPRPGSAAQLRRIPLAFDPASRLANPHPLPYGDRDTPPSLHFERPEGSVAARGFGNAVHAFLELLVHRIAAGESVATLLAAIPSWAPRVAAILRSEGLPPTAVERLALRVLHSLTATLKDPIGLWLLAPHLGSATEYALTAWTSWRTDIRIDRVFRGGPEPLSTGESHLWIVDYKTTMHGPEGIDTFLAEERAKYAPQMAAYASVLGRDGSQDPGHTGITLALYFPLLARLIWWHSGPEGGIGR